RLLARGLGDLLRGADAGDHVFALGIDQELAVELLLAGRWIAREDDARAEVSPMLPNTMACTLTAVPQLSGIPCRRRYVMPRWFIHEPNTAPIAPHSCACGSCGNGAPCSSSTRAL